MARPTRFRLSVGVASAGGDCDQASNGGTTVTNTGEFAQAAPHHPLPQPLTAANAMGRLTPSDGHTTGRRRTRQAGGTGHCGD